MTLSKSIHKFKEIFWLPIILLHLVFLVNTQFTLWPEMVIYPYLANHGFLLYRDIVNPYTPSFMIFLNFFSKIFGYSPSPYQLLTWAIIAIIDISVFIIVLKIAKNYYSAALATLFFVIFSIPFGINGLWFDLVQTPILIFSLYYFYNYICFKKAANLQKSFYLVIIAFFIKQQALWLIIFYVVLLFAKEKGKILKTAKNLLLPLVLFCFLFSVQIIYFYRLGTLGDFIFWTVYQPLIKGSSMPGYVFFPTLKQILIIFIPIAVSWSVAGYSKAKNRTLILLSVPLILFAYPRFDFFHLIPYLAAISISLGAAIKKTKNAQAKMLLLPAVFTLMLGIFLVHSLSSNWHKPVRFFEQDIFSTAAFLKAVTPSGKPIYIQNGPDQLYPLSERLPIKPWIDEFPWYLEIEGEQQKVVSALKSQDPPFVVFKPYDQKGKYDLGSYRPTLIADYLDASYMNLVRINNTLWLKVKK